LLAWWLTFIGAAFTSMSITSWWPFWAAHMREVTLVLSALLASAFASSSVFET